MSKVYIYGRGLGYLYVKKCINKDVKTIGFIDNYSMERVTETGIPIIKQEEIVDDFDYIIVSIINYEEIRDSLIRMGIDESSIICFFDLEMVEQECFHSIIDQSKWKSELMWKYNREIVWPTISNISYELYAEELNEKRMIPHIIDVNTTVEKIITNHCSLVRFGDGEFEIMLNRNRPRFQRVDKVLANRLREVLNSNEPEIMIAIANNYGSLSNYNDDAACGIRCYMTQNVRREHMGLLDLERDYHDAYLSRPYLIYRDKDEKTIQNKFNHLKEIWSNQDVLIVEGEHTRFGVGNDLLDGAKDVKRILAPDKNAFDCYDEILDNVKKYGQERLVLSILGPTATVLTYDLAKLGYWAVDIGQVDTEYEWFLRGATIRCDVPYKTVSEYADKNLIDEIEGSEKEKYESQILAIVR